MAIIMGIDIGGTGIKGAPVDTKTGKLTADRFRVLTPQPATPEAVAKAVGEVVAHFNWKGPIGCGFPAALKNGVAYTAANVDPSWIGTNAKQLFETETHTTVNIINDADAAGVAEMRFGAGRGKMGVVFLCTLGTGIGSALFVDGKLVPNTELGHIEIEGKDAETRASEKARIEKDMSWRHWAHRVDKYLEKIQSLIWPDLIIIGGGVSKEADSFISYLTIKTPVVVAQLLNDAGIIGSAISAETEPEEVEKPETTANSPKVAKAPKITKSPKADKANK
jgi:polyphosphate glucokinase